MRQYDWSLQEQRLALALEMLLVSIAAYGNAFGLCLRAAALACKALYQLLYQSIGVWVTHISVLGFTGCKAA